MIEKRPVHDRDEWLRWRQEDLTASDIAAAAGLDQHKSALTLYAEKMRLILPAGDNALMRRGRWMESAVLAALAETHPDWQITPAKMYLRDPALRIGATPDALAVTNEPGFTNVQCKVVSRPAFERHWSDGAPLGYQLQTLTEGMLLDVERSLIAALVIDTYSAELHEFTVPRHPAAEARVLKIAERFWRRIAEHDPPPADYTRDAEVIEQLHPVSVAEPVLDLTGDNALAMLLPEHMTVKAQIAAHKERLGELEAAIKDKLGDAERATLPGWKISWKTQTRKEHLVRETSYRVLRVASLDDKEEDTDERGEAASQAARGAEDAA